MRHLRRKFLALLFAAPVSAQYVADFSATKPISKDDLADAAVLWSSKTFDAETFQDATLELLDLVNRYRLQKDGK